MGLFNFITGNNTSSNSEQVIQLTLNEDSVIVSAAEAEGLSIAQLFSKFAGDLGDTSRISRYINDGRVVEGTAKPVPGTVYRASVGSESKG